MSNKYVKIPMSAITQGVWDLSVNNDPISVDKTIDGAFVMLEFAHKNMPMAAFATTATIYTAAAAKIELATAAWTPDGSTLRLPGSDPAYERTDVVNSRLTYVGDAWNLTALTADPVWRIKRISVQGEQTITEFACSAIYSQVWDDRATIFPTIRFSAQALVFDGDNDYVNLGDIFDQNGTSAFSISFWLKLEAAAGSQGMIYSKLGGSPYPGLEIIDFISGGNSFIRVIMANHGTTNLIDITMSNALARDEYVHVCVTYDGSQNASGMKIYVDTVVQSVAVTKDTLDASASVSANVNIGRRTIGGSHLAGELDELSFWSKELSVSEISELYNDDATDDLDVHSATSNLVNWYIDEFSFPTVTDMKGSDDGTMTNMESGDIVAGTV